MNDKTDNTISISGCFYVHVPRGCILHASGINFSFLTLLLDLGNIVRVQEANRSIPVSPQQSIGTGVSFLLLPALRFPTDPGHPRNLNDLT